MLKTLLTLVIFGLHPPWGFFAHEKINRLAVFTLPPEMIGFYKQNLDYITRASVNPDKRRYVVDEEAARHYLDIDHYGDSALQVLPQRWDSASLVFSEDTLQAYGILPWHIYRMYHRLKNAFMVGDPKEILRISADLGHYIADAHVPLHTTENYNGQLTGQEGIHGFWESRLPELFNEEYNYFVGRASYIDDPQAAAWDIVAASHGLVEAVLEEERALAEKYGERKYAFETRGGATVKVYAKEYAHAYHQRLNGMVERQLRSSIKVTGDFWFTAWVDAGQPDMQALIDHSPSQEELDERRDALQERKSPASHVRPHE